MLLYFGHLGAWVCFFFLWGFLGAMLGKQKVTIELWPTIIFSAIMAVFSMLVHVVFFLGNRL